MRILYIVLCMTLLVSCGKPKEYGDHTQWVRSDERLIHCHSDINIPNDLLYYQSKQVVNEIVVPQQVSQSFKSYYITDVLGNVFSINSNEIPNYKCYLVEKTEK